MATNVAIGIAAVRIEIVRITSIARWNVEIAVIRAKPDPAAIVIRLWLNVSHYRIKARVGDVRIRRDGVFANVIAEPRTGALERKPAIAERDIHIELAITLIIRMKRHPQQSPFTGRNDAR